MKKLLQSKVDYDKWIEDNKIQYPISPEQFPCLYTTEWTYLEDFEIKCENCKSWRMISVFNLGDFGIPQTGRCNRLDITTPFNFGCIRFNIYE
jgi:hypothetical protein